MTISVPSRTTALDPAPLLARPLGPPRLTAGACPRDALPTLEQHLAVYGPLRARARPSEVVNLLARYAVLGRGGAGFPLLTKLQTVLAAKRRPVVVVNASEGEPAIWKDRTLLARVPHLVLDGAQLAAAAVGADIVHVAVNPTFHRAHQALALAVEQRRAHGDDVAPVKVHTVPDEFTAGESSSVIRMINGGPARPAFATAVAAVQGVDGRPTLLSNAETFAQLAMLATLGDRYADVGAPGEPGTMMFTVRGAVRAPVVVEAPLGTPVGALVAGIGHVTEPVRAVLVGGYHGRWLPVEVAWNAPLSVLGMRDCGGTLGAGLVVPLPADACPLSEVARVAGYLASQTAQQCGPCVNGLPAIAGALNDLADETAGTAVLDRLVRWSGLATGRGVCKHPDGTVGFVRSALDVFAGHVEDHLRRACRLPWRRVLPVTVTRLPEPRSARD